jgi:hypothetical protein
MLSSPGGRQAVSEWAAIEFKDNRDACTFTVMVSLTKVHQETTNAPKKGHIGGENHGMHLKCTYK